MSAPYNWCDRRCDRCPLRARCAAAEDRPLEESLGEAVAILEDIYAAEGITPPDPSSLPAAPLGDDRLRRFAFAWAAALDTVAPGDPRGVLVVGKIARITCCEAFDDADWLHEADTVPNLLLLERVLDEVRVDVERWRTRASAHALARFDEQDRTLRGLLAPRFAAIADSDRAIVTTLAAAGFAPSPFL